MKPIQRLPESSKDRTWRRNSLKYWYETQMKSYLNESDWYLLELASGKMKETNYSYITNPFGLTDKKYQQYPAKLRNFDFIGPLFLRWISEYKQRVFEPIVYTKNSNFDNEQLAYEKSLIEQSMQQKFVNMIIESGAFDPSQLDELGDPVQPPMSPEVIKQKTSSLKDSKTIMGQHAIDYIVNKQELDRKYRKAFEYFIKLNKCVTYKDVRWDEVICEVISPVNVQYWGNRNNPYLENAEAVKVTYYLTFEELLEIFQDELDEYKEEYGDILTFLETENNRSAGAVTGSFYSMYMKNRYGVELDANKYVSEDKRIRVDHIQFTSFRKVKIVMSATGEKLELTEDYQGEDVIEEVWYPEEREGYVIAGNYFIGGHACEIQRRDADNPFSTKKNYNGVIFLQGDTEQLTPVERLAQYQEAYNAVTFKIQKMINKDLGKLMTMPLSLMQGMKNMSGGTVRYTGDVDDDGKPKYEIDQAGVDVDSPIAKNLYYAEATGIMFIDDTAEGFTNAIQALKSIDVGLSNSLQWLYQYRNEIKLEAENLLGFNPARTGGINTSEKVANSQQNLVSGSLITEEYNTEFEEFRDVDLQGILDLSKFAFRIGKKANYVRSNRDIQVLSIDEGWEEATYGIFTASGAKSKALKDILTAQATQILQNYPKGGSTVAKLVAESRNYANVIEELEANEDAAIERDQANKQADRDAQIQAAQIAEETRQKDRELKIYEIDTRRDTEIAKQGIMAAGFNIGKEGGDNIAASLIAETNKQIDSLQKNALKAEEIRTKERIADKDNQTKLQVSKDNKIIARENKGQ